MIKRHVTLFAGSWLSGLALALACSGTTSDDDEAPKGTGGGAPEGSGGAETEGTGGAETECLKGDSQDMTGGGAFVPKCPDWLGVNPYAFGEYELPETCSGGGQGGANAGDKPALRRLCEFSEDDFSGALYGCLRVTSETPCSGDHESAVLECVADAPAPYCDQISDTSDYQRFVDECGDLTFSSVVVGLNRHGDQDALEACIEGRPASEPCDDSFLGCAYGLF